MRAGVRLELERGENWVGFLKERQQVSLTAYADDVAENEVIKAGERMEGVVRGEGEAFAEAIGEDGMRENCEKAIHLVKARGTGSQGRGRSFVEDMEGAGLGQVLEEAKYLGNMVMYSGSNKAFVRERE